MMRLKNSLVAIMLAGLSLGVSVIKTQAQIRDSPQCVSAYVEINKLRNEVLKFNQDINNIIYKKLLIIEALRNRQIAITNQDLRVIYQADVDNATFIEYIVVKANSLYPAPSCQVNTTTSFDLMSKDIQMLIQSHDKSMEINNQLTDLYNRQ